MSYDFDGCTDRDPPKLPDTGYRPHPQDLEVIVTCLSLAAIELSPKVESTFTRDELFAVVHQYDEPSCTFDDRDLNIVLPFCKFLQKLPGKRLRLR
jgi:hypothetical protein